MEVKTMKLQPFTVSSVLVVLMLLAPGAQATRTETPSGGLANLVSLSGWLAVIWGDGPPGSNVNVEEYWLTHDNGQSTRLLLSEELTKPWGGRLALNQRRVTVEGKWTSIAVQGIDAAILAQSIRLEAQSRLNPAGDHWVTGPQPWLSILCKFSDVTAEPKPLSYFQGMYSETYPGLDHYWRELSYNMINTAGSSAVGWYTLPHPRSYYVYDTNGDGKVDLDHIRAANDCTAAADPFVYFPNYVGINLMFNSDLDGKAWGGSRYMTLDGVNRSWRLTWEPPWGYQSIGVIEHEMGHGFGMPHSSGAYGQTYDNEWDVMSDNWSGCSRGGQDHGDPVYGCMGQHTIAYHKDHVSWMPAGRKFVAASGNRTTITLERLALPLTDNYLMAQIPIAGSSTRFYTVEARRLVGYDSHNPIPGEAVVIHEVDTTRERPAYVVDMDNNGDTGDAGAMWLPGEVFSSTANGITVCVNSATSTGFVVTVGLGAPTNCSFQADLLPSLQTNPAQPQTGQRITLTTRLVNWGGVPAQGTAVTSTIPNDTTLVPGSATTSQGAVTGSGPLAFNVGTLAYDKPVTLTFGVTVSAQLTRATMLSGPVAIAWTGGSLARAHIVIVNGLPVYLPAVIR
jgi:M6 family metalloprotease-like protein/uncharacterized repeat protein (TIGR01451 family)